MKEKMAAISTAPEATSFTIFISLCLSGCKWSANLSIAELIASKLNTSAEQIKTLSHSFTLISKYNPSRIKIAKKIKCKEKLRSFLIR